MDSETLFWVVVGSIVLLLMAMGALGWVHDPRTPVDPVADLEQDLQGAAQAARRYGQEPRVVLWALVEVGAIFLWVVGALVIVGLVSTGMAAAMGQSEFERANVGGPLVLGGTAVAILGSFLTHRWIKRRNA